MLGGPNHTRLTQAVLDEGLRLPGWMNVPTLATPENVSAYLGRLSPEARQRALSLIKDKNETTKVSPKTLFTSSAPIIQNREQLFFPDPLGIIGAIGLGDKFGELLTWLENKFDKD